eukprot:scaffold2044_cov305-Pavlova_lutheri.AAC.19
MTQAFPLDTRSELAVPAPPFEAAKHGGECPLPWQCEGVHTAQSNGPRVQGMMDGFVHSHVEPPPSTEFAHFPLLRTLQVGICFSL